MSHKLIVLPEDVYRSMGRETKPSKVLADPLDSALITSSDEMLKILRNPSLSAAEKYAQYDQKLKRVQKILAEREEKLQNVTLNKVNPNVLSEFADAISTDANPPLQQLSTQQPLTSTPPRISASQATIKASPSGFLSRKAVAAVNERRDRLKQLQHLIGENQQKFGITKNNRVLNDSRAHEITGSNVDRILSYALGIQSFNARPNGTETLLARLRSDPQALKLLGAQSGRGKRLYKKRIEDKLAFKPKIWRLY